MAHSQYQPPSWDELEILAGALAKVAHSGQTRDSGEDYFEHASRVAASAWEGTQRTSAMVVGYLHDVVEDTVVTFQTLSELFPQEVVLALKLLTRNPEETYGHYINRLIEFGSDDALAVKLADLADNMRDLDTTFEPDKARSMQARYRKAFEYVLHEQDRRAWYAEHGEPKAA